MGLPVTIREARADEHPLIYSAWIRTQRKSAVAKTMHPRVHAAGLHRLIERILADVDTTVTVAEYEGVVVGFLVWSVRHSWTIHYAFVKEPYRRQGIMKTLLTHEEGEDEEIISPAIEPGQNVRYTHAPEPWRDIKPPSSWVYDPWAAWALEE